MSTIKKIVLTGGPCAGKTTAKAYLAQKLGDVGFHVVFVPEAPTLLLDNGVRPGPGLLSVESFQQLVLDLALDLEAQYGRAAAAMSEAAKPVLIFDRGIRDGLAYVEDPRQFTRWLKQRGLTPVTSRDARYHGVFHLRTAALGAEQYYSLDSNPVRLETATEAKMRDGRTLAAWTGHPHLRVIPNTGTFEQKLKHLLAEICVLLGIPQPVETERKFLVRLGLDPNDLTAHARVDIEQFYLLSNDSDGGLRFRKRSQNGDAVYFRTYKRPGAHPASRIETEDFITAGEYEFGKQFMLPGSRFVRKVRHCFVYEHQYFELDEFSEPALDYCLLELELAHPDQPITLPPFLKVVREVTGEPVYANYALAFA